MENESSSQFCRISDTISKEEREIDLQLKQVQLDEATLRLETEKIYCLHILLTGITIDEEKTVFNSEPVFRPIYSSQEAKIIKDKIMASIKALKV